MQPPEGTLRRPGARDTLRQVLSTETDPLAGLVQPGSHGSIRVYLRRLWERREYAWHVPVNDLRSQQMNTVLGNAWHLLNPALSIAVYYVIFGLILGTDRGVDNFIAFLAVGVFVFQFTQKSTTAGSNSLVRNYGLLRSISFPRALLPLSAAITETLAFVPMLGVMIVTALASGVDPSVRWLAIVPLCLIQLTMNIGLALIAARATNAFRDIQNLLPFIFRLLFYGSGVLFSVDAYLERDALRWLFVLNPVYDIIELQRWAVLGYDGTWYELLALTAWATVLLVGGFVWFRRAEATYGA